MTKTPLRSRARAMSCLFLSALPLVGQGAVKPATLPQVNVTDDAPTFVARLMRYQSGDAVPDLDLITADGKATRLSSFRGKPVLVALVPQQALAAEPPRVLPVLADVAARFQPYGVATVAIAQWCSVDDYKAWAGKNAAAQPFPVLGDPAGVFTGDKADDAARLAHHQKTVLGVLFGTGMYPALPACFALDGEGKLLGSFFAGNKAQAHDGVANLLLHGGIKLAAKDLPTRVAPESAFAREVPRPPEAPVTLLAVGAKAPDFAMTDRAGKPVRLADQKGKVIVLDFWATWCGPCKLALPHVQEVATKYADQNVVVIASCTSDGRAAFDKFVDGEGKAMPNVLFAHDPLERAPERASRTHYGVSGIPQQFVIKDGVVVAVVDGYTPGEVLLDAALAKAGVKVDAATLEKAAADQKKRDERSKKVVPAVPMKPAGG